MQTASVEGSSDKGKCAGSIKWLDELMNLKDLPQYLQLVMQGLAEDLSACSVRERKVLAAIIYGYRDVFSSGQQTWEILI